jgi:anti-sigma factor RsiW
MACDSLRDKLDAYIDGELSTPDARDLGAHLRQCSDCAADALARVQMKRAVSIAGRTYRPNPAFRQQIEQSVKKSAPAGKTWAWKLVLAPALLVLIISVSLLFFVSRESGRRSLVFGELADLHVSTLASATPVDVVSTDRHTVKPWFEGKIPFAFNLPELQGTNFTLVGGRVAYLEQSPGAQLVYKLRNHELSVFIFQERGTEGARWAPEPVTELSFTFETWGEKGLRYFVVGDVGAADVASLSKLLSDAQ